MDTQIESFLSGGVFKKLLEEKSIELRQRYDIKKAELEILYFLSNSGKKDTSTDIHHQLLMNRGHISQAVDRLCQRKYIIAVPDEHDHRYVHYKISDSAAAIIADITQSRNEISKKILSGISEEELKIFQEVSGKIRKNMEELL